MITLDNGCPQLEPVIVQELLDGTDIDLSQEINQKLKEWHESRRCVNCIKATETRSGLLCSRTNIYEKETFSCQAFQEKK